MDGNQDVSCYHMKLVDTCSQMQWPLVALTLVLAPVKYTWTVLYAVVVRPTSLTVHTAPSSVVLLGVGVLE